MSRRLPLRLCSTLSALGVVALGWVAVPAAAGPSGGHMVALGDSYASGVGTRVYYRKSGDCKRSPKAYPVLDSARIGATLAFVACSGATTRDVESDQLGPLSSTTTDVTVTVGGNDIGFATVIATCALPSWAGDCFGAIRHATYLMTHVLPGRLTTLYGDIRGDAPSATVVVVGYPRLFNGEDCNGGTFFTRDEEAALNHAADQLARIIRGRATAAGFGFVDPRSAFTGHEICDDVEWINGLSDPLGESFHPNVLGHQAYARLVLGHL